VSGRTIASRAGSIRGTIRVRRFEFFPAMILTLLALAAAIPDPVQARPMTLSAGGGIYVPWSRGLREVYGSGGYVSGGLAFPFSENRSRLRLEAGYVTASGRQIRHDPTFEIGENKIWLVPISLGLETNAHRSTDADAVRVWVGLHAILAFTGWEDPVLGEFKSPAMGGAMELRPEIPIHRNLALWASYRLTVLTEVEYQGGSAEFGYSSGTMQAGLAYDWH
jgi:hypothetical protein